MRTSFLAGAVVAAVLLVLSIIAPRPALAQFAQQGSGLAATGASVALSSDGNTAIVGSPLDNSHDGAARVFVRDNAGNWTQQGTTLTGDGSGSNFGSSVAMSSDGDTAIVGEALNNSSVGAAFVFTRSGTTWSQQQKLTPSGAIGSSKFGQSVALSADGNTAIVGGPGDNFDGAAWTFTRSGSTWSFQQELNPNDSDGFSSFGQSVALSADGAVALIGGYGQNSFTGAAWIFTQSAGSWSQQGGKLTPSDANGQARFGSSVALSSSGGVAMIGGYADTSSAGAAWVFKQFNSNWLQNGNKLTPNDAIGSTSQFGWSVALSADGHTAMIGGPGDNSSAGAAWAFMRHVNGTFNQQGNKLTAGIACNSLGVSAALSSDGNTALVGCGSATLPFVQAPTIIIIQPNSGSTAGGDSVQISGTGFTGVDTAGSVTFGGIAASDVTVIDPDTITVTTPSHSAGTVDVVITNSVGSVTGPPTFTYLAGPTVTGVSPSQGPTAGGINVTITGANLLGATAVKFDTLPATYTIDNDTQITAVLPARAAGTVAVSVSTPGGTDQSQHFTYLDPPQISAVAPAAGPVGGGTSVTITGTNLSGASAVKFGSTAAVSFSVNSGTTITAHTPAHVAGTVAVSVTTAGGTGSKAAAFAFDNAPTITAINPNQGPANGGTLVSIVGTNLTGATGVKFGATPATSFSASSATKATATAPPHAEGAVNVTIVTPGGSSAANAGAKFTYTKVPVSKTIAKFTGGKRDGANPNGWLVADAKGAFYGTTSLGGAKNLGTVFKLTPGKTATAWTKTILHSFTGQPDGSMPYAGLTIDSRGNLYGTTSAGGMNNAGAVVKLSPPGYAAAVLYSFKGPSDGSVPIAGVARDAGGSLYGTTVSGGAHSGGTLFKLTPNKTGTSYGFSVLHAFSAATGVYADGTVILDKSANIYGTGQSDGAHNAGVAFKISPSGKYTLLHVFGAAADGKNPNAGLVLDSKQNLYGTTTQGGATGSDGAVFKLSPPSTRDTPLLLTFTGTNGMNPNASLVLDGAGILYGTTTNGGAHTMGTVFKLIPPANSQTAWTQSVMYSFKGGATDGAGPTANVLLGKSRTLYGTTRNGGSTACGASSGCGTVFMVQY